MLLAAGGDVNLDAAGTGIAFGMNTGGLALELKQA